MTEINYTSNDDLKRCSCCKNKKTKDHFTKDSHCPDGLCRYCRECVSVKKSQYVSKNPEKVKRQKAEDYEKHKLKRKAKMAEYYLENKEYLKKRSRDYNATHKEEKAANGAKWYQEHRQEVLRYSAEYRRRKPYVKNSSHQRRRARKRNLPNTMSAQNWEHALNYFHGCCAVCGRSAGLWHKIAADHWIPLSAADCPGTVKKNIVPLCHDIKGGEGGCNNSKRGTDPVKWLTRKVGLSKAMAIAARIQTYFDSLEQ